MTLLDTLEHVLNTSSMDNLHEFFSGTEKIAAFNALLYKKKAEVDLLSMKRNHSLFRKIFVDNAPKHYKYCENIERWIECMLEALDTAKYCEVTQNLCVNIPHEPDGTCISNHTVAMQWASLAFEDFFDTLGIRAIKRYPDGEPFAFPLSSIYPPQIQRLS